MVHLPLHVMVQQVAQEKDLTESKYKQERSRRIKAEKRLRLAEDSLKRLDKVWTVLTLTKIELYCNSSKNEVEFIDPVLLKYA